MYYDKLCLSGGGLSGFLTLGCLYNLNKYEIISLKKIKKYYGTSIGAIICFLLSIGYDIKEIIKFILKFDFKNLQPDIDSFMLFEHYGINNGIRIMTLLQTLLENKINKKDISFIQLFNKFNIELNIFATNYSTSQGVRFNHITHPQLSVLLAVRMSISIPIIFTPVEYNNQLYVDGCLTNNFPIKFCDKYTLGIYINFNKFNKHNDIIQYIYNTITIVNNTITTPDNYKNNIELIGIDNLSGIDFDFNQQFILNNIKEGKKQSLTFIYNHPRYITRKIVNEAIKSVLDRLLS